MGDHLGSPGVVDSFILFSFKLNSMIGWFELYSCLRPYRGEITGFRLISKVKTSSGLGSTRVADHLGSPGVVDSFLLFSLKINKMIGSLNFTLVYDHTTVKSLDIV